MNDDVSCRALIPILEYAKKHGIKIDRIINGLPVDIQYLENPKNWVPRDWFVSTFYRCEEIFNDPLIMYRIGMDGWSHQKGAYSSFIRLLLRPSFALPFFSKLISLHTKFFKFQVDRVAKNELRFVVSYVDNKMAHRHGCLFNLGWTAGFAPFVWKAQSEVIERECVCGCELDTISNMQEKPKMIKSVNFGSKNCVFHVKWKKLCLSPHSTEFVKMHEGLLEDALNELLKSESHSSMKSTESEPIHLNPEILRLESISPREMEIIKLVTQGNKNKEIAKKLGISRETVKKHLNNIYKKLSVKSRFELIAKIHNHLN